MSKKIVLSPKVKRFFAVLGRFFKGKEKQAREDEDDLGAYPLRMQISAIPERRYLRTTRLFAVLTFINLGILIAIAGIFVYYASRINIQIANRRVVNVYSMDPERKVVQASEYQTRGVPAMWLLQEQAVRDYITARHSYNLDPRKQAANWSEKGGVVAMYTHPDKYKEFIAKESGRIVSEARGKQVNKEVHIYSLNQTPAGMWEALLDVFDMPPEDPFNPLCNCSDNSKKCIACKEQNNKGRHRLKVYARIGNGWSPRSMRNPFGMQILQYFVLPQIIHPEEKFWGIPAILRPEL